MYVCMYVCVYLRVFRYIHVHIHIHNTRTYTHTYIHTYIYIYINTHTYTHISSIKRGLHVPLHIIWSSFWLQQSNGYLKRHATVNFVRDFFEISPKLCLKTIFWLGGSPTFKHTAQGCWMCNQCHESVHRQKINTHVFSPPTALVI